MKLYIGNKNYSSWSMRPWVLMREKGIAFDEVMLRFDSFSADSQFKQAIAAVSPAGRVPALVDDDGLLVWDTLAIAEYLAERFPEKALWPTGRAARARARSVCAEMHSGFGALRGAFPMNIEARLPEVGARLLAEKPAVAADLARITALWTEALAASGGPFLFGDYSIADAYFAPVASRIRTYALPLPAEAAAYVQRLWATAGVQAWEAEALTEADFVPEDEPYRTQR
ncbi:glutathione S-transferase family protein [Ideonella sp. DXS22W]|uniref:Glutathione S-transferase family protein n=1 Tax=Pseudaquabacterium inlustre TaxID=2984192 RepID=A0ABU9CP13_9BURK